MVLIETIGIVATVIAIAGVILNNNRIRSCFILWLVSNGLTLAVHVYVGIWSMCLRDIVFLALAVHGWKAWGKKVQHE